jgi:1,4-dihydroxy-2-naphthoate octaprenyltransferase
MDSSNTKPPISKSRAWILASRPKTLPAAASPVIIACTLAYVEHTFKPWVALAAFFGALLLQIGANLANDVFDYQHGTDRHGRYGPTRMTQAGLLSPTEVKTGMWIVFALAAVCGIYMTLYSGWWIIIIGLLAVIAAIAYTGGPFPYGYKGLGEVFVFIFFGFAAVCGTYYAQAGRVSLLAILSSVPVGLLIVAILVVNNLRDLEGDRDSGKRTLAVRFGPQWTQQEFIALLALAYLFVFLIAFVHMGSVWVLLCWLSLPLAFHQAQSVMRDKGKALNLTLANVGKLTLIFSILYAIGLVLSLYFPL